MFFITACSSANKGNDADNMRVVAGDIVDEHGIVRMQPWNDNDTAKMNGKVYTYAIQRVATDSLMKVKNDAGEVFVDNIITLRVSRGSEKVFSKTFTKESFSTIVDQQFMKRAILEGLVFDKVTPQGLRFIVSVSYPQTDMYIPVALTIAADGKMSMAKNNEMFELEE